MSSRLPVNLAQVLHQRIALNVANPIERALAATAGSDTTKWITQAHVADSTAVGWCEGGSNVVLTDDDGRPRAGQRIRLIHRATRLPWQDNRHFPSQPPLQTEQGDAAAICPSLPQKESPHMLSSASSGEVDSAYIAELKAAKSASPAFVPKLVFLDVDHVLASKWPLFHERAPSRLSRRTMTPDGFDYVPDFLRGTAPWYTPDLVAHLTGDAADFQRVIAEPRYPVTSYMWRERVLRDTEALGALERLLSLQRIDPDVRFVMATTHISWFDAAIFRDVLLYPLKVVGCVWPRHLGGILQWLADFIAPTFDRVSFACVDDSADFFRARVLSHSGLNPPNCSPQASVPDPVPKDAVANVLVHVPRKRAAEATKQHSNSNGFRPLAHGEAPLIQQAQMDDIHHTLENQRTLDPADLTRSLAVFDATAASGTG